jgi:HlyD family secretion protein
LTLAAGADRTVLNASGYVTARREATVSSKVTGKVVEVLIEEGMKVKDGQVLARLDDSNVKASLDVARPNWTRPRRRWRKPRRSSSRRQGISAHDRTGQTNIASQSDLDKAESNASRCRRIWRGRKLDVVVARNARWRCGSSRWTT